MIVRQHRSLAPEAVLEINRIGVLFNQLVAMAHRTQQVTPEITRAAATVERLLMREIEGYGP